MTDDNGNDVQKVDITQIAKEVMTGGITDEHVSALAKMTAKQIYQQGWNAAINAAQVELAEKFVAPDVVIEIIGKLKK